MMGFSNKELDEIAEIFYNVAASKSCNVLDGRGCPIYTPWRALRPEHKEEAIAGLRQRIERETLSGYLERKRPTAGAEITEEIVRRLKERRLLR